MAPSGEMFRYPQHFGENVLRHGSHEWLPYSDFSTFPKQYDRHQFVRQLSKTDKHIMFYPEGIP